MTRNLWGNLTCEGKMKRCMFGMPIEQPAPLYTMSVAYEWMTPNYVAADIHPLPTGTQGDTGLIPASGWWNS